MNEPIIQTQQETTNVPAGYKRTEVGVIPEEWEVSTIGSSTEKIVGGGTPSRTIEKYWGGSIPWMTVKDFITFRSDGTQENITMCGLKNSSAKLIRPFTVIIATRIALGEAAIYNVDVAINQDLKALFTQSDLKPKFLYYWLIANKKSIIKKGSGSTVLGISLKTLINIKIPLPPLPEQQAIARVLSDMDDFIEAQEQLIAKKKQIKKGAMQELLQPKADWEEVRLGDVCEIFKGKGLPKSQISDNGIVPCIHYGQLFVLYNEIIKNVKSRTNSIIKNSVKSKAGDVLMPTSDVTPNGLATASCITVKNVFLGGDILIIRPLFSDIFGEFISYYLNNSKGEILKLAKGVTVFHIYGSDMKEFKIKYPSIKTQNRITSVLYNLNKEIEALQTQLEKYKHIKKGMMQDLLTGKKRLV